MKRLKFLFATLLLLTILSCDNSDKVIVEESKTEDNVFYEDPLDEFKSVRNIEELVNTDFSPTLESKISKNSNIIYSPTIVYCWDEIRNILGSISNINNSTLQEIHDSESHIGALKSDEYTTSVDIEGQSIIAKSYFKKSLPFSRPYKKYTTPLTLGKDSVSNFGFNGESHRTRVNYYNDKSNHSLTLLPSEREHEIIVMMTEEENTSLSEIWNTFISNKEKFRNSKIYRHQRNFNEDDKVRIPSVNFNLEKNYQEITGSTFNSSSVKYEVEQCYQRNAFILNEKGAEVESEAIVSVVGDVIVTEEIIQPKIMIYNKPFTIFLKRRDSANPYFAVHINDSELLEKFVVD